MAGSELPELADAVPDERLRLIFLCCHPALATDAQMALTLRLVCGVPTSDIARVFLASEPTVAARRSTRVDAHGRLLRLEEQDRSQWDRSAIAEAREQVTAALRGARPGRYVLQAAVALVYVDAPTYEQTDWAQILALYDRLLAVWPSPVVALNRTVALAQVEGPAPALAAVEALEKDPRLAGYQYLPAIQAELLSRLGRTDDASVAYRRALELTTNEVERDFLERRLARGVGERPRSRDRARNR